MESKVNSNSDRFKFVQLSSISGLTMTKFGLKIFFGWKKCFCGKKICVEKIFWVKKIFQVEKFLVKKELASKKFGVKKSWVRKFVCLKKQVGLAKGGGYMTPPPQKIVVGLKFCWVILSCPKRFL